MAYVDEGHFLHATFGMIRDGTWDSRQYLYPQLPRIAVAAVARVEDGVRQLGGRASLRDRIPPSVETYDELEPFVFLVTARALSVAVGLAIVVITGLFARRLTGPVAGAVAALLAAFVPALVLRGSIASVDSYAALAAIGVLAVTDLSRTTRRPLIAALAAGGLAGAAFGSKYPAVLVFLAFVGTTALLGISPGEKIRRLVVGSVGLILGTLLAMPALWWHPGEILHALQVQRSGYASGVWEPSLWHQALVEAESTLHYGRPEIGIAFCVLAFTGLLIGFRRPDLRPSVVGWCAFIAALLILFGSQGSRPFRNLLPLVPLGCVSAGIGYAGIRSLARRPAAVDAVGSVLLVVLFVAPLAAYAKRRFELQDPRRLAVDWLAVNARPGDAVVVAQDLAILDGEMARVPGRVDCVGWDELPVRIRDAMPRLVVAGVLMRPDHSVDSAAEWPELAGYRITLRVGEKPTPPFLNWWRGNEQIVVVLERKAPG
jgi:4-amino-4-deoxy-L-arabinose transferase-like glycosyltransferase